MVTRETMIDTIRSRSEFDDLLKSDALVLYVDVDWAMQARQSRPVAIQLRQALQCDERLKTIRFRRVDCTQQSGELWDALRSWFREQCADDRVIWCGGGGIVWIRSGKLVDTIGNAAMAGLERLVALTDRAFAERAG